MAKDKNSIEQVGTTFHPKSTKKLTIEKHFQISQKWWRAEKRRRKKAKIL